MKNFLLLSAAALSLAACTQDKPAAETAATTALPAATDTTAVAAPDTIAYRTAARRTADRVAQDLAVTDPAVRRRLENTYYTRAGRIGELEANYATDTAGRYQAMRMANDQADEEIRTTLNNPASYSTYATKRAEYGEGPYSAAPVAAATAARRPARQGTSVGQGSGVKKMEREDDGDRKTKYENGAKVKVNEDGSRKIKLADGTKIKIDENGKRTVK